MPAATMPEASGKAYAPLDSVEHGRHCLHRCHRTQPAAAMRYRTAIVALGLLLGGCGLASSPWLAKDWKCSARDSDGNPFFGVAADQQTALEKARWQCVSGSPYKQSCTAEPAYCRQLE